MMQDDFYIEPINGHYRIISRDGYRSIVFSDDAMTLEQMERICYAMNSRVNDSYKIGFRDGYERGYEDGRQDIEMMDFFEDD